MMGSAAKFIGGKVLTAVLAVACIVVVIWYWRLPPEARAQLWSTARDALIWIGFAAVLPWGLFFVPPLVVKAESNVVSALALLGYLAIDVAFALYLAGGSIGGGWQAGIMLVGFLSAGVYNFVVCEFLAARSEDSF